jgi:fluoroacetyl-CoA thioesterase
MYRFRQRRAPEPLNYNADDVAKPTICMDQLKQESGSMSSSLVEGIKVTRRFEIDEGRTIAFMAGDGGDAASNARVYATPEMIRDIEQTCRDMLLEYVDEGQDSLGTEVNIKHLAPTLLGMWSEVTVTVAKADGRAVTFDVTVADTVDDVVGKGTHNRFIIDVDKVKMGLAAKAKKATEAS